MACGRSARSGNVLGIAYRRAHSQEVCQFIAKGRGQRAEGKRLTGLGFSIWRES